MNEDIFIAHWQADPAPGAAPCFDCGADVPDRTLADADAETVRQALLDAPGRVFVGAAALNDGGLVERLATEFGGERVGVCVSVAPMSVSWRLETVSNADFRTVNPSMPEPCWEIVAAHGERTGVRADWWLGEMLARGASAALVVADLDGPERDRDLNICAGLAERCGDRLWLAPAGGEENDLSDWARYGHVGRFLLPAGWGGAGLVAEALTDHA